MLHVFQGSDQGTNKQNCIFYGIPFFIFFILEICDLPHTNDEKWVAVDPGKCGVLPVEPEAEADPARHGVGGVGRIPANIEPEGEKAAGR